MASNFLNCLHVPHLDFPTTATLLCNQLSGPNDGEEPLTISSIYKPIYVCAGEESIVDFSK